MSKKITKFNYEKEFWFEDGLVWLPKATRAETRRNIYALKTELILRIAKKINP